MEEDVFKNYRRKLRRKKKRKYRPTNDFVASSIFFLLCTCVEISFLYFKIQEEKKAFTKGDKFWKLFQACELEIGHANTPDAAHFCLKVERLILQLITEPTSETETRLQLEVKEHVKKKRTFSVRTKSLNVKKKHFCASKFLQWGTKKSKLLFFFFVFLSMVLLLRWFCKSMLLLFLA